jgi:NAD(P)-dependent dehydrogenase (short-subunit alcohol dehydrogenase family)
MAARLQAGLRLLRLAVETHLVTSHHALPLLLREPGGLLVEVTDGTRQYNATRYRLSVFYDLAKEAVNRIAWSQAQELGPRGATALSITPGWMRSGARWNGASTSSGAVAQEYGFTDVDGTRPDAWRYIVEHRERGLPADDTGYR